MKTLAIDAITSNQHRAGERDQNKENSLACI